jgi:hypothetical protein
MLAFIFGFGIGYYLAYNVSAPEGSLLKVKTLYAKIKAFFIKETS